MSDSRERWWFTYRWYDADGVLLYVGITIEAGKREREHRRDSWWTRFATRVVVDPPQYVTRDAAEDLELAAIRSESPVFNKQGASDPHITGREYLTRRLDGAELEEAIARLPAPSPVRVQKLGPVQFPLMAEIREGVRVRDEAAEAARVATEQVVNLVLASLEAGVPPTRVAKTAGWSGAYVRKLARDSGIPSPERYADRAERLRNANGSAA